MKLERTDRVRVVRAVDPSAPGTSDLERLAQLLRVDAVGVADRHDGAVRVVWWGAPGQAFPGPVEDLLSGSLADWVVAPLPDGGTAFARISSRSSVRTPAVLQTVAPIFAATLAGRTGDEQGLGDREAELASGLRPLETALAALRDDLGFGVVICPPNKGYGRRCSNVRIRERGDYERTARPLETQAWEAKSAIVSIDNARMVDL